MKSIRLSEILGKINSRALGGRRIQPISMATKSSALLLIFCFGLAVSGCRTLARWANDRGTVLTVEIETDDAPKRAELVERAMKIFESRLYAVGADGEAVRVPGVDNQISVKIYNPNDLERLKKLLFTTHQLELKKAITPPSPAPLLTFPTAEAASRLATGEQEVLPYAERDETLPPRFIIVEKTAVVTGEDVRTADAVSINGVDYSIAFSLKPEGAERFGEWTGKNSGNYLAIVLDKKVQSAAYIKGQIFDSGQIEGRFTKLSAEEIALTLRSGSLPAKIKIIEEKSFGN